MRRLFIVTAVGILAVGVGWRYAPQDIRQKLLDAAGRRDQATDTIAAKIKDAVKPDNPVARRAALAAAIKQKIEEIAQEANTATSTGQMTEEAEHLVDQLTQEAGGQSISGKAIERVLERILPASQCKE